MFLILDIRLMNNQAVYAAHTGMIILGGGLVKHHICNANLMVSLSCDSYCTLFYCKMLELYILYL